MKVQFINLSRQWERERKVLLPAIDAALSSGNWVGGPMVEAFEEEIADYCQVPFAISVNSGTDALNLSLRILDLDPAKRVITTPNSYVASATAPVWCGLGVGFTDVGSDQNLNPRLLAKLDPGEVSALIAVHLTGKLAKMDEIVQWASSHGVPVIEDMAQAVGASFGASKAGSFGKVAALSLHPLKNLNSSGDGGVILTHDEGLAAALKLVRQNGHEDRDHVSTFGTVSRLDPLQATITLERLRWLPSLLNRRREIAHYYLERFAELPVDLPYESENFIDTYHLFVVQVSQRDSIMKKMRNFGIETKIHYPILIPDQEAFRELNLGKNLIPEARRQNSRILSLPINQELTDEEVVYVADCFVRCFG